MPRPVGALRENPRRFELQVLERPDNVLLDLLRAERIDLAIVTTGIDPVPADITEESILRDPFDLIVVASTMTSPFVWPWPNWAIGAGSSLMPSARSAGRSTRCSLRLARRPRWT